MNNLKVYGIKLRYVFKYIGIDRKMLSSLLDNALTGGDDNIYKKTLDEIDPYHLIRFKFTKETPIAYTISKNKKNAADKFLEVLVPLVEVQMSKEVSAIYDRNNFISMVYNNTKQFNDIHWEAEEKSIKSSLNVEDVVDNSTKVSNTKQVIRDWQKVIEEAYNGKI